MSPWIHKCLLEIMHPVFIHRVGLGNTAENRTHVLMIVTFITIITIRATLYKLSLFTYTVCEHMTARYPLVQHPLHNRGSTRTTLDTIVAPLLYTLLYILTALHTHRSTYMYTPLYKRPLILMTSFDSLYGWHNRAPDVCHTTAYSST